MEPSAEAETLAASGSRGGGLVEIQGPRLPDANQPDPAESDGRGEEEGGQVAIPDLARAQPVE